MNVQPTTNRIPKIILKSLYEAFHADDEQAARAKLATVEGMDVQDGLALAELARSCSSFQQFNELINVQQADSEKVTSARLAAQVLTGTAATKSKWFWEATIVA